MSVGQKQPVGCPVGLDSVTLQRDLYSQVRQRETHDEPRHLLGSIVTRVLYNASISNVESFTMTDDKV